MAGLLSKLGLMRVSERPDVPMRARAAETLEQHIMDVNIAKSDAEWWAQKEIAGLRLDNHDLREQIATLRPDALAMRRKRQMDRDRRANNRKGKA